jgi:hypothetical protein
MFLGEELWVLAKEASIGDGYHFSSTLHTHVLVAFIENYTYVLSNTSCPILPSAIVFP